MIISKGVSDDISEQKLILSRFFFFNILNILNLVNTIHSLYNTGYLKRFVLSLFL